jgi:hypothetical protein
VTTILVRYAVPAFAAVWLTHVVLTLLGDPVGRTFDLGLWIVSSVLRVASAAALIVLLARVHAAISGNAAKGMRVFAQWSAIAVLIVLALAVTHEWWAPRSSGQAMKYYSVGVELKFGPDLAAHRTAWLRAWTSGLVVLAECALAMFLCGAQVLIGVRFGKPRRWSTAVLGCFFVEASLLAYLAWCPWFRSDFDMFHGELFAGALLFDFISPLANDPYSTIATWFYLGAWAGSLLVLRPPPASATP